MSSPGASPGRPTGLLGVWRSLGWLLTPAAWVYRAVVAARRRWWRTRARSLSCPVVSVGNLTCGGTGKTPTVEMVARDLLAAGWHPAILSRGYKAPSADAGAESGRSGGNDEFRVLAANLPSVPHHQGRDRWASGQRAIATGADVVLLDDGFQHLQLRRDLDLVLVDATDPLAGGRLLPAGPLREPLSALGRASLVGITRCDLVERTLVDALAARIAARFPALPLVRLRSRPLGWHGLDGRIHDPDALADRPVLGFCGIGNPAAFRRQLLALHVKLAAWKVFPDHHDYTSDDVDGLARAARDAGATALVMTQKDAVKLAGKSPSRDGDAPLWCYLKIAQTIESGGDAYRDALAGLGAPRSGRPPRPASGD